MSAAGLLEGMLQDVQRVTPVPVHSRHQTVCTIASFDSESGLREAAGRVMRGPDVQELEMSELASETRAALTKQVPALANGTEPFMWIRAIDVFETSDTFGDILPPPLSMLREATLQVTTRRFQICFDDLMVRRLAAGGLLQELHSNMKACLAGSRPHKVSIFSGHDTTLMPVLACLQPTEEIAWPGYASVLCVELYAGNGRPYIQFVYNGTPLHVSRFEDNGLAASAGDVVSRLSLDQFSSIVSHHSP